MDELKDIAAIYANMILEQAGTQYDVVQLGGSIGGQNISSKRHLKGMDVKKVGGAYWGLFDDKNEAKDKAKRMNKNLSPGEKKYYGIKYIVAEVVNGKYTGK